MKEGAEDLVVLPRRVAPQPTPEIVGGGDCGACVLAGLLGTSIENVYASLQETPTSGKGPVPFGHRTMPEALRRAYYDTKCVDRYIDSMPSWPAHEPLRDWGNPSWMQSGDWWKYVHMALEAGYYALTTVDSKKGGPLGGGTDHWVMLCGARLNWTPFEYESEGVKRSSSRGAYEVLVSCSSRKTPDEEWVEAGAFLKERGGFFLFLVKPRSSTAT